MRKGLAVVEALLIADKENTFLTRRLPEVDLEFGGIRGDRHFGITAKADVRKPMYPKGTEILNRRQISIVSKEECSEIASSLSIKEVRPEWLGANILLSGIADLTQLPPGSRIIFPSGAGLVCENENLPCSLPADAVQQKYPEIPYIKKDFIPAAKKKRGIVCMVERPGSIHLGDSVTILYNDLEHPMQ